MRWLCVALCVLACSGGGTRRIVYDHSQEMYRSSSHNLKAATQIVILPVAYLESENIEGIGTPKPWETRAQEHLLAAFTEQKLTASVAQAALPPIYQEVVEIYLQKQLGAQEENLLATYPTEAKTYLAYKAKIAELHPREWARKWGEFSNNFGGSPFVPHAKERAAALKQMPPHYPPETLAAFAQSASHIIIPSSLKWVRSQTNIGGVPHQVFAAEIELEILDAKTGQIIWRGYGVHKIDDQDKEPLDLSLQKAAVHVVKAAL
jgi:hypothetical protein